MIDFEPISSLPDFSTPLWRSRNLRFVGHTSISPCMDGSTQQPKPTVADKFSRSGRVKGNLSGSHCTEQPISVEVADRSLKHRERPRHWLVVRYIGSRSSWQIRWQITQAQRATSTLIGCSVQWEPLKLPFTLPEWENLSVTVGFGCWVDPSMHGLIEVWPTNRRFRERHKGVE